MTTDKQYLNRGSRVEKFDYFFLVTAYSGEIVRVLSLHLSDTLVVYCACVTTSFLQSFSVFDNEASLLCEKIISRRPRASTARNYCGASYCSLVLAVPRFSKFVMLPQPVSAISNINAALPPRGPRFTCFWFENIVSDRTSSIFRDSPLFYSRQWWLCFKYVVYRLWCLLFWCFWRFRRAMVSNDFQACGRLACAAPRVVQAQTLSMVSTGLWSAPTTWNTHTVPSVSLRSRRLICAGFSRLCIFCALALCLFCHLTI